MSSKDVDALTPPSNSMTNTEAADVIEKSYNQATKARKTKAQYHTKTGIDAPDEREGVYIQHPDASKQDPRDYLLIARVVKRNTRPLTIAEVQH